MRLVVQFKDGHEMIEEVPGVEADDAIEVVLAARERDLMHFQTINGHLVVNTSSVRYMRFK